MGKIKEKMPKFYFYFLLLHHTIVYSTHYETITLNAQKEALYIGFFDLYYDGFRSMTLGKNAIGL